MIRFWSFKSNKSVSESIPIFAPSLITILPFKVKVSSDREIRSVSDCIPILLVEKVKLPIFKEPLNSWTSSPVSPNWLEPEA